MRTSLKNIYIQKSGGAPKFRKNRHHKASTVVDGEPSEEWKTGSAGKRQNPNIILANSGSNIAEKEPTNVCYEGHQLIYHTKYQKVTNSRVGQF